jgi:hypothetical protein
MKPRDGLPTLTPKQRARHVRALAEAVKILAGTYYGVMWDMTAPEAVRLLEDIVNHERKILRSSR